MGDLPGILPPDAGRLERAARRYAIALLSDMHARPSSTVRESAQTLYEVEERQYDSPPGPMEAVSRAIQESIEDAESWMHLRARVALYLRWCERVEGSRARPAGWMAPDSGGWIVRDYTIAPDKNGDPCLFPVWAQPLWTQAPAHDPTVTAADRRATKEKR